MSWVKLDDGFIEHAKVENLSDRAFRLHVAGLCHCAKNLTDGLVTGPSLRALCGRVRASKRHVAELVDAGLWVEHEARSGHIVWGYTEYNPTASEVKDKREKRAAAGRLGGLRSGEARREANASSVGSRCVEPPARTPKDQVL